MLHLYKDQIYHLFDPVLNILCEGRLHVEFSCLVFLVMSISFFWHKVCFAWKILDSEKAFEDFGVYHCFFSLSTKIAVWFHPACAGD